MAGVQDGLARALVASAERAFSKAPPDNGHVLYAAAAVWSLAAQAASKGADNADKKQLAGQYADQAAALLVQTLDKGFHDLIYPEHNRLMLDPALAAALRHPRVRPMLPHQP